MNVVAYEKDGNIYIHGTFTREEILARLLDETNPELVAKLTAAVREADRNFEQVGGSSKHWVKDCFIPSLKKHLKK